MPTFVIPHFVSEIESGLKDHVFPDGTLKNPIPEDCVWDAGLMEFLGSHPGGAPATHHEAEELRNEATGNPFGPSNTEGLLRGFKVRYDFVPTRLAAGPDSIRRALKPGTIATVSGHLSNLPAGHRLRRFSPAFSGGHRSCVLNDGSVLVLDPLGPPNSTYH